jgi:hypothetical protein
MIEMGDFLRWGHGLNLSNPKRAVEWYERAFKAGADRAKMKLFSIYERGQAQEAKSNCQCEKVHKSNNVNRDPTLALLWLGRAAQTGSSDAYAALAQKMEDGYGLPANQPEIAERYWRLAADSGSRYAQVELAERLRSGRVLEKEQYGSEEALTWLNRARNQGSPRAALYLAEIHRNGEFGVKKDPEVAKRFAYEAIELALQTDPITAEGNPFYEIAAGHLLVEMAKNGEIDLGEHQIARLTRFYGAVDPESQRVKVRRLRVPIICSISSDGRKSGFYDWIWVWDWGRDESPTELQFRSHEHRSHCNHNELYRATLSEVFKEARKNRVPFADLIQQKIKTAAAVNTNAEPDRQRRRRGR